MSPGADVTLPGLNPVSHEDDFSIATVVDENTDCDSRYRRLGEYFFNRLQSFFKSRFTHDWTTKQALYATEKSKQRFALTWGRALSDLSREQLQLGFLLCERDSKWPPATPAEFRELCLVQPHDVGLPDWRQAYRVAAAARAHEIMAHESTLQTWQHAVIWHAAHDVRLDWWYLSRQCSHDKALKAHFEPVYLDHIQLFAHGDNQSIPSDRVLLALPDADKPQPSPDERVREEAAYQGWRDSLRGMGLRLSDRSEVTR